MLLDQYKGATQRFSYSRDGTIVLRKDDQLNESQSLQVCLEVIRKGVLLSAHPCLEVKVIIRLQQFQLKDFMQISAFCV